MRESTPIIAILPGLDGLDQLSDPLVEVADDGYDFLQISYPVDRKMSLEEYVDYVEERLPHNRPIIPLGISFSGPITVRLLTRNNRDYRGAIFCTTFVRTPHPFLFSLSPFLPMENLLRWSRQDFLLRAVFLTPRNPPDDVDLLHHIGDLVPPETLASRLEQIRSIDESSLLEQITVPCCAIRASHDLLVPGSAIRPFYHHLKNFEAHDVPGPHAILLTEPEQCWEIIHNFIDNLAT